MTITKEITMPDTITFNDIRDAITIEPDNLSPFDESETYEHELHPVNHPDAVDSTAYIQVGNREYLIEPWNDYMDGQYSLARYRGLSKQQTAEYLAMCRRQYIREVSKVYRGDIYYVVLRYEDSNLPDIFEVLGGVECNDGAVDSYAIDEVAYEIARQYQDYGIEVTDIPLDFTSNARTTAHVKRENRRRMAQSDPITNRHNDHQ